MPVVRHPGDLLSYLIFKTTGMIAGSNCACAARQKQMNDWGWLGCLRHRATIIEWLCEEAAMRGHKIEKRGAAGLLRAAVHELKRKRNS